MRLATLEESRVGYRYSSGRVLMNGKRLDLGGGDGGCLRRFPAAVGRKRPVRFWGLAAVPSSGLQPCLQPAEAKSNRYGCYNK
jgi:hypothetical protein